MQNYGKCKMGMSKILINEWRNQEDAVFQWAFKKQEFHEQVYKM